MGRMNVPTETMSVNTHTLFIPQKLFFYLSDFHLVLVVSLGVSTTASQPFLVCTVQQ